VLFAGINPTNPIASLEKAMKKVFIETYKAIDDGFLNEARKW
jgi:hypothetical protein